MKRPRLTEEQIRTILKQGDAGIKAAHICRNHGISEATYYNWRAKYKRSDDAQKLEQLREENARLKQVIADLVLGNISLKETAAKNS